MLSLNLLNIFLYFVYLTSFCYVSAENVGGVEIPDRVLSELYLFYKEALPIEEGTVSFRRVFANNKKYEIHVMKLNEVNGNKRHNLMIKEDNASNPLIYIDNPVETKIPNAYLTFEEFKKELTARVLLKREEFIAKIRKGVKVTEITKPKTNIPDSELKMIKLFINELVDKTAVLVPDKRNKNKTKKEEHQFYNIQLKDSKPMRSPVLRTKIKIQGKTGIAADTKVNSAIINISKTISITPADTEISHNAQNNTIEQTVPTDATTLSKIEDNIKNTTLPDELNEKKYSKENLDISTIQTTLETPEVTIITENPIEPEVTDEPTQGESESTIPYEISTTTQAAKSKRTKFSRPHVFQKE